MGKITDERVARVRKWIDGGGSSWGLPMQDIEAMCTALSAASALPAGEREPVGEFLAAQTKTDADIVAALSHRSDLYLSPYASPPASELEALRKERDEYRLGFKQQLDGRLAAEARLAEANKVLDVANELESAGNAVFCGLNARIDAAPSSAKPVFSGIADLHDALGRFRDARAARRVRDGGQADG